MNRPLPRILLFGKDGQLGWELQRSLVLLGELVSVGKQDVDLTDLDAVRSCIRLHQPTFIVNAAAYTAVDKAEIEPQMAHSVNQLAVQVLAEEAFQLDCWLIHYSTDYVFDGEKSTAYLESDEPSPLNVYGQTKYNGEKAIRNSGCKYLILRSSWVYSTHGMNFPLTILRQAISRDKIDVLSDSFGAPTSASLIADITAHILYRLTWDSLLKNSFRGGIYHLTASGKISWYDYAKLLVNMAKKKGIPVRFGANKVFPIKSEDLNAPAKRPKNSQLDNKKLCNQFGIVLPEWQVHVEKFMNEVIRVKPL